jgi:hypothetical protein
MVLQHKGITDYLCEPLLCSCCGQAHARALCKSYERSSARYISCTFTLRVIVREASLQRTCTTVGLQCSCRIKLMALATECRIVRVGVTTPAALLPLKSG